MATRSWVFGCLTALGLVFAVPACSGSVRGDSSCTYAGKTYAEGASFAAQDGCNTCTCSDGDVACSAMACQAPGDSGTYCEHNGKRYAVGASVPSGDSCNSCTCMSDGNLACTAMACPEPGDGGVCSAYEQNIASELEAIQSCTSDEQCGQVIQGSSCGCTRNLVARKDANLQSYQALVQKAAEVGCGIGGSTCDCPQADGFACKEGRCAWNYVEPAPECTQHDAGELCVRGTVSGNSEVLKLGDVLRVSVRPKGCFSSSCSKIQEASCTIAQADGFDVKANFCIADTSNQSQGCTADCGKADANCSFGQPLTEGAHKVTLGTLSVAFQVPAVLPLGGLCAGSPF